MWGPYWESNNSTSLLFSQQERGQSRAAGQPSDIIMLNVLLGVPPVQR